jgi:hypothetical protein
LFLKEEIEALREAVEKLAPFVVYQSRCWTRAGGPNADPLLPSPTICGICTPLSEIGQNPILAKQLIYEHALQVKSSQVLTPQ